MSVAPPSPTQRQARSRYQRGMLAWLQQPGDPAGLPEMRAAVRHLEAAAGGDQRRDTGPKSLRARLCKQHSRGASLPASNALPIVPASRDWLTGQARRLLNHPHAAAQGFGSSCVSSGFSPLHL